MGQHLWNYSVELFISMSEGHRAIYNTGESSVLWHYKNQHLKVGVQPQPSSVQTGYGGAYRQFSLTMKMVARSWKRTLSDWLNRIWFRRLTFEFDYDGGGAKSMANCKGHIFEQGRMEFLAQNALQPILQLSQTSQGRYQCFLQAITRVPVEKIALGNFDSLPVDRGID